VKDKKQLKNDLFIVKENCKFFLIQKQIKSFNCRKRLASIMNNTEKKMETHRDVITKIQQQISANR
jgi:hypothetical protein